MRNVYICECFGFKDEIHKKLMMKFHMKFLTILQIIRFLLE